MLRRWAARLRGWLAGPSGWDSAILAAYVTAPVAGVATYALIGLRSGESWFGRTPQFTVWQLILVAEVIVLGVLAAEGLTALRNLDAALRASAPNLRWKATTATQLGYGYLLVLIPLVFYQLSVGAVDVAGMPAKIGIVVVLGLLTTVPFLVVLKRIQIAADSPSGWGTAGDIQRMRDFRQSLQGSSAALGLLIAMAVLATGALHQALTAGQKAARRAGASEEIAQLQPFPDVYILLYGLLFTGLLAGVYIAVLRSLDRRSREIVEAAAPIEDPTCPPAEFKEIHEKRTALATELQLGGGLRQNLEGAIAVLSPLATAVLTSLAGIEA